MYTLDRLLEDVLRQRGALKKGGQVDIADYVKVWDAFNRYLTATVQKRQTLNVPNFCKIGWRIEELQGKAKVRPHFQLAESFGRVYNLEANAHPSASDRGLSTTEEFNFSKAAIRYSQSLSKDNIFMGLRAMVHMIGEAASRGEQVCIDFEIGKLVCSDRDCHFAFVADLYLQEGLDVPNGAVEATDYKPSVTFAPPSKDALTLSLQGTSVRANGLGGWVEESPRSTAGNAGRGPSALQALDSTNGVVSHAEGRDWAQMEALNRHLTQMEEDAAKAMLEKDRWEGHLKRCTELEQKDQEWRRTLAKDYAEQLKLQMRQAEEKRAHGREQYITHASMHEFPSFVEPADADVREYVHERRAHLKEDLDQQCEAKRRVKQMMKQHERQLEMTNIEVGQAEMARLQKERVTKKEAERAALSQAWQHDVQLKNVRKAIEDHHKTPGQKAELHGMVATLGNNIGGSRTNTGMPTLQLQALDTGSGGPPSERLSTGRSTLSGSVRRMPLGAAASLALHKDKMGVGLRR